MNWIAPQSEDGWGELLSAYLDGELPEDEARSLESYLRGDAARQKQLDALRRLSNVLADWEAPEVRVPSLETRTRMRVAGRFRWIQIATGFAAGVAAGLIMAIALPEPPDPARSGAVEEQVAAKTLPALSPARADILVHEAAADALRGQIVQLLVDRKVDQAEERLAALQSEFPDTRAATAPGLDQLFERARERFRVRERRT